MLQWNKAPPILSLASSQKTQITFQYILNICPKMHFIKLPLELLVCSLSLYQDPLLLAKAMPWERCQIVPIHLLANALLIHLHSCIPTWLDLCPWSQGPKLTLFLLLSIIFLVIWLMLPFTTRMLLYNISRLWPSGLRSLLVKCLPLFIQTEEGNLWLENLNCSSYPEASLIKCWFLIHPNKTIEQRGLIKLCLKKQKPYANMLVCRNLSGNMLLKLHSTFITINQCIVVNRAHPLNSSMERNQMYPTSGTYAYIWIYLDQQQDKLSPKSEEIIFIGYEPNTKGYYFWSLQQQ